MGGEGPSRQRAGVEHRVGSECPLDAEGQSGRLPGSAARAHSPLPATVVNAGGPSTGERTARLWGGGAVNEGPGQEYSWLSVHLSALPDPQTVLNQGETGTVTASNGLRGASQSPPTKVLLNRGLQALEGIGASEPYRGQRQRVLSPGFVSVTTHPWAAPVELTGSLQCFVRCF